MKLSPASLSLRGRGQSSKGQDQVNSVVQHPSPSGFNIDVTAISSEIKRYLENIAIMDGKEDALVLVLCEGSGTIRMSLALSS
jgi:hypothetical protein